MNSHTSNRKKFSVWVRCSANRFVRGVACALALGLTNGWANAAPEEGVARAGAAAARAPLRVLVVRGLWNEQYRIDEGLARAGTALIDDAWVWDGTGCGWPSPGDQGGGGLMDFPDAAGLAGYDVVVVANVNAKAFGKGADDLVDYVRNGGSLFLLGGRFAFGKAYKESALAAVAPVEFPGLKQWGSDLTAAFGRELKPGADRIGSGFAGLAWDRKPVLYWYHDVTPKSGARVLLAAGDAPVLVAGESGKGRVVVFAGTVMGDPAEGQAAFWAWDGWPAIEAAALQWLAEAHLAAGPPAVSEGTRKGVAAALAKMETASLGEDAKMSAELEGLLLGEARRCRGTAQAGFLLRTVAGMPADISAPVVEALQPAMLTFVGPEGEKPAREMIGSGQPYRTALGLALLGGARAADAAAVLGRFYETGKPKAAAVKEDAGGSALLDGPGGGGMKPVLERDANAMLTAIRGGALAGLGQVGDGAALTVVRKAVAGLQGAGAPRPKEYADVLSSDNRLYQQALVSALRCGDESAAGPLVDALLENIYIIARARNEGNKGKDRIAKVQALVDGELVWQREMYRQLAQVPDKVRPALATRMAAEKDRRVTPLAFAVFGGRAAPAEAEALLAKSPVPAVAALVRAKP